MIRALLLFFAGASMFTAARAYDFIGSTYPIRWPDGDVPMILQLDQTRDTEFLSDGSTSWNAIARRALGIWNTALTGSGFQFAPSSGSGRADGNDRNEVFFSSSVYGHRFGYGVLAITTTWRIGVERVEGDTIFNASLPWDSYRGEFRGDAIDFQRVAIHEFGHTVGLDHPDQAKQVVSAIMNSIVSDLDSVTDDDIHGAQVLYEGPDQITLNVVIDPPGSGMVLIKPDNTFFAGTLVTLTPKPTKGFRFSYWDAPDPSSSRMLKLRLREAPQITAHFVSNAAPRIVSQPRSQFASVHDTVVLKASVANARDALFQWKFEGAEIPGATEPTLILRDVGHGDSGLYQLILTTTKGETATKPARLVVDGY